MQGHSFACVACCYVCKSSALLCVCVFRKMRCAAAGVCGCDAMGAAEMFVGRSSSHPTNLCFPLFAYAAGFLVALHVPLHLVAPIMDHPRPGGLMLWRLVSHGWLLLP